MNHPPHHCRRQSATGLLVLFALLASGCTFAKDLVGEPSKDDPMDGYQPYLSEGGQNTLMDLGPGQTSLMTQCAQLKEQVEGLRRTLEERDLEINKLQADLATESSKFDSESRERAQSEAASRQLKQKIHQLESQVLTLSVQKAELDVELTKLRIAQLQGQLESGPAVEAATGAAMPAAPMNRGRL